MPSQLFDILGRHQHEPVIAVPGENDLLAGGRRFHISQAPIKMDGREAAHGANAICFVPSVDPGVLKDRYGNCLLWWHCARISVTFSRRDHQNDCRWAVVGVMRNALHL